MNKLSKSINIKKHTTLFYKRKNRNKLFKILRNLYKFSQVKLLENNEKLQIKNLNKKKIYRDKIEFHLSL